MTKLLEDLVFFVCVVPNNGQDVLSVVTANPNRERQKLMREQNILAQVRTRMHSPTHTPVCPSAFVWLDFLGVIQNLYQCKNVFYKEFVFVWEFGI